MEQNNFNNIKLALLGEKIRKRRNELGLTVKQVAEISKIPASSFVTFIENAQKRKPNVIYLRRLLQSLQMDYLYEFKELGFIDSLLYIDSSTDINNDFLNIPVYKSILAGYECNREDISEYIKIPSLFGIDSDIFAVEMSGNSMEPSIEDKSIVLIKKSSTVQNNKIGAFLLNGKSLLKRYFSSDDQVFLRSDNSSLYPDIPVKPSDDFITVGFLVGNFIPEHN